MDLYRGCREILVGILTIILIAGCSGGGGGIDGSGGDQNKPVVTTIEGTAAEGKPLQNRDVIVRDANGIRKTVKTNDKGEFSVDVKDLQKPYLLKIDNDEGKRLYSLASTTGTNNIHPFSDVVARNWFKSRGFVIDDRFDDSNKIDYPTAVNDQIVAIINALKQLLIVAFQSFDVSREFDFQHSQFSANSEGFDKLLDYVLINIKQDKITIKLIDPDNGFQAVIILDFDLTNDISMPDTEAPTMPGGLLAFPVSDTDVVLVWNPSTDNVGVAGYRITRDDGDASFPITTPFPVFTDPGLIAGTEYCYSVQAFDGAFDGVELSKGLSPAAHVCVTPKGVDTTAPEAATGLSVTPKSDTELNLTWLPSMSDDVIGYDILRGPSGAVNNKIATVVPTNYGDFNLTANTQYCYIVKAFDATGLRSVPSSEMCATTYATPNPDIDPPISSVDLAEGTYTAAQTVHLSCSDIGGSGCANIYYTTSGLDPTTASATYSNAINIDATTTLKFFAVDNAGNAEVPVHIVVYTIDLPVVPNAPVVSGTALTNNTTPTWSWTPGGGGNGTYRYKLDDSNLDSGATQTSGTSYTPAAALGEGGHTLYVQERNDAGDWSLSGSFTTVIDSTAPMSSATPAGGSYTSAQSVHLSCIDDVGTCVIYYTIDGTDPTTSSAQFASDIVVNSTMTIKYFAVDNAGNAEGIIQSQDYIITLPDPIKVDVSVLSNPVQSDGRIFYAITVSNISSLPVNNINVTYTVPTGIEFRSDIDVAPVSSACVGNVYCIAGESTSWNIVSLAAGASETIHINALVQTGQLDGALITAPISVTATELSGSINIDKTVEINNSPSAELTLSADKDPVMPGETYRLILDVGNISAAPLSGTELRAFLPAGVTVVDTDGGVDSGSGEIVWDLSSSNIAVGAHLHREVQITAPSLSGSMSTDILKASAQLTFTGGTAVDAIAEHAVTMVTSAPPLLFDIGVAQTPAIESGRLYYTLTVSNTSFVPLTNVAVTMRLPAELDFRTDIDVVPTSTACVGNVYCVEGETTTWNFASIPAGGSQTINVNANVAAGLLNGTEISVPLRVVADQLADTISLVHTVPVDNTAAAELTLSADKDPVMPGETYRLLLDVGNISAAPLSGTGLRLILPEGVTVVDAAGGDDTTVAGEISWSLATVGVGIAKHYEVQVTAPALAGTVSTHILKARAQLTFTGDAEVDAIAEHAVTILTTSPPLTFAITATPNPVTSAGLLTYKMTVTNTSLVDLHNVKVTYRVPPGVDFRTDINVAPASSACVGNVYCVEGETTTWTFASIAAGSLPQEITITDANVLAGFVSGTLISSPILVTADELSDTISVLNTVSVLNP